MRMRAKRLTALMLGFVVLAGSMAGCGSKGGSSNSKTSVDENGKVDTSEHVDLTMYLIGAPTEDFDMMWEEVNKYLDEKLNCTVQPEWLSWDEESTKYSLLFSGNENFDLIFTASSWGHYEQMLPLNAFYALDEDFIKTYGPDLLDAVPEAGWEQVKNNGVPYMVPNYYNEWVQDSIAVRGDLMEKYGFDNITSLDDLYSFYEACAADGIYGSQGGPNYYAFMQEDLSTVKGTPKNGEFLFYNSADTKDTDFYYLLDQQWFTDFCKKMQTFAKEGVWSPDVLNSTAERQDGLLNGTCATLVWNKETCAVYAKQANTEHPDWNVKLLDPLRETKKQLKPYSNAGMAINANSENPERAMMVLNALYTDQYLQELTRLGIEGTHWEAVGDDQYTLLKDTLGVDSYCDWGWRNAALMRTEYVPEETKTSVDEDLERLDKEYNENVAEAHPYDGFTFDPTNVSTQYAAVEAAYTNYYTPLINGMVDDVDASIEEFKQVLDSAGMQDVIDELNRQAEEYLASK